MPGELFDADQCSRDLLAKDPAVREAVREKLGPEAFQESGEPDRAWLRELVFAQPEKRRELEQILHPAIRAIWSTRARAAAGEKDWFFVDIPLLFETGVQDHFAAVVVVACAPATQRARLLQQRHLSPEISEKIIASQLDLSTKIAQADYLIWNDSSTPCLDRQARLLAAGLRDRHTR